MNAQVKVSLRDRLLRAASLDELENLRAEGRKYNNARPTTRSKWRRAFAAREAELKSLMTEDELKAREAVKQAEHAANMAAKKAREMANIRIKR